eukprot:g17452.t2
MALHLRELSAYLPGDGGDKEWPTRTGLDRCLRARISCGQDMWELHWEVIARPLKETQCLCLQRICPDAKVKARMVPTRAADVEVLPFDHVVVGDLRTRFARIVAELRTAGDPKGPHDLGQDQLLLLPSKRSRRPTSVSETAPVRNKAMSVQSKGSASAGSGARSSTVQKASLLSILVLQNCACAILVKQSRKHSADWVPQTGVIVQEAFKGLASLVLAFLLGESMQGALNPVELLQSSVPGSPKSRGAAIALTRRRQDSPPALLYLVQNNLQYVALAYLEPATYTVTYQLKILSTAVCFVLILGRQITVQRWLSLGLLVLGVVLVQLATFQEDGSSSHRLATGWGAQITGLVATVISAAISGLAGVYTEKILKNSKVTLWVRNVQLAAC